MPQRSASSLVGLFGIVLLAIGLRAVYFVGLVSGDPQDDGVYYRNAYSLYHSGAGYLDQFRNLPPDHLANPIDQFHVRPMITYPIAASFAVLGPGEFAAAAWAFVCSILTVVAVYALGSELQGRAVGLMAALLCAFYPLEVIHGTRILSDVQVALGFTVGLWLLTSGRQSALRLTLCGVAAAGAYLANGRGLVVLAALTATAVVMALRNRLRWSGPAWIVLGFSLIAGTEAVVYYSRTGDPLLSYHIQSGASQFKYLHEPVSALTWGPLSVRYTNGRPFELTKAVLRLDRRPTRLFGPFFYLFLAAAAYGLIRRRNLSLLALAAVLFLYLDFGPISVQWDRVSQQLRYFMVFKQERFLLLLSGPLLVLAGVLLAAIGRRHRALAGVLLLLLGASSLHAIGITRNYYRAGLHDLRVASQFVLAHPERAYYGDLWAIDHVRIFTSHKAENVHVLDPRTTLEDLGDGCLILGGGRGVELLSDYVASTLPPFAREALQGDQPPSGWAPVLYLHGRATDWRTRDLTIYCRNTTDRSR